MMITDWQSKSATATSLTSSLSLASWPILW